MKIYCSDPRIIWHPHAYHLCQKYRHFTTPSGIHHNHVMHINKNHVTEKNIDKYTIVNPDTGETYPIFLQVPCGKCPLCLEKRSQQWSFRCLCEAYTSNEPAYFVTLTYNDKYLPAAGVDPRAIQLFFKRLRIALDRQSISHNIRYVAVAEYGSKSARPHYHISLFGYPSAGRTISTILHEIERAWSVPTGNYNSDGSPVVESLGFAYCLPIIKGGINYVTKYMTKSPYQPKNMNNVFMLTSRKNGGIGSAYAESKRKYYLDHPDDVTISVPDIYSGKIVTQSLPSYFKSKYFPSVSQCLPTEFSRVYRLANYWFNFARDYALSSHIDIRFAYPSEFISLTHQVKNARLFTRDNPKWFLESDVKSYFYKTRQYLSKCVHEDIYANIYHIGLCWLQSALCMLPECKLDRLDKTIEKIPYRLSGLRAKFDTLPEVNIDFELYRLRSRFYDRKRKEKI